MPQRIAARRRLEAEARRREAEAEDLAEVRFALLRIPDNLLTPVQRAILGGAR
jgi:hypothetical protein